MTSSPSSFTAGFSQPLQAATGRIDYTLTNDYMFHILLQNNEAVLRGLIGSLLHLTQDDIYSVEIKNPILFSEKINNKEFILDIQILLNTNISINLELQVENEGNWADRSLSYLCRNFDQLYHGQDEYYGAAEPPVRCGESHLSGLTEPPIDSYSA